MKLEIELNDEFAKILEYYISDIIAESDVKPDIADFLDERLLSSLDDDRLIEICDEHNMTIQQGIHVRAK